MSESDVPAWKAHLSKLQNQLRELDSRRKEIVRDIELTEYQIERDGWHQTEAQASVIRSAKSHTRNRLPE